MYGRMLREGENESAKFLPYMAVRPESSTPIDALAACIVSISWPHTSGRVSTVLHRSATLGRQVFR